MVEIKQNKGITLIALIITIIVMLILAGITINLTIGQDGIMNMAKKAGENYIDAERQEKNDLEDLYSSMMVATNDDSKITISMEDLNSLIQTKTNEAVQTAMAGQRVSDDSYEIIQSEQDFTLSAGGVKYLSGTSKFGTIDSEGNLTFSEPGLYYVSSSFTSGKTAGGQIYNQLLVNDKKIAYSFENVIQAAGSVSATFYANEGDKVKPQLVAYNANSTVRVWNVVIYKIY